MLKKRVHNSRNSKETTITKELALSIIWEARDGIIKPDIAAQIAGAMEYSKPLPFKGVEQLRREGIWLEDDGEKKNVGQGVTLIQSFLPEGCVTCELAELISGIGEPVIWPYFADDVKKMLTWRTQRALLKGFHWKPDGLRGWIFEG